MEMSYQKRRSTGAFYTPKIWADKAVEYLKAVIPSPYPFTFYDPAAGEGSLLDALPEGTLRFGTTLEAKDVEILIAKGYEEAEQFDFLTMNTRFLHPAIHEAAANGTLIVFTNPPFFKLPADRYTLMKRHYPCCHDATALFLLRILYELKPLLIASFHKADIYQSPQMAPFRSEFQPFDRLATRPFMCSSSSWPHLKGRFPICFSVFWGHCCQF